MSEMNIAEFQAQQESKVEILNLINVPLQFKDESSFEENPNNNILENEKFQSRKTIMNKFLKEALTPEDFMKGDSKNKVVSKSYEIIGNMINDENGSDMNLKVVEIENNSEMVFANRSNIKFNKITDKENEIYTVKLKSENYNDEKQDDEDIFKLNPEQKLKLKSLKHLHLIKDESLANEIDGPTAKFKSMAEKTALKGEKEHSMDWKAPLRRRINIWGDIGKFYLNLRIRNCYRKNISRRHRT